MAGPQDLAPAGSWSCHLKGSSFSSAQFFRPARRQRPGDERQEQLMVTGDGITTGCRSATTACGRGGTLHYILHRAVVLDKVEVRSGNGSKRNTQVADNRNSFKKHFGQQDGRTPVEVDPARMHSLNESAEEPEIKIRGRAERGAVDGSMHVGNVGADGEMDGYRYVLPVSGDKHTRIRMLDLANTAVQNLGGRLSVTDANAMRELGKFVEILAGFFSHTEFAGAKARFHVFRSVTGHSDFEIVNEGGSIHGDSGNEAALHQIDQDGAETDLDDVSADAPDDSFALAARHMHRAEKMAEILAGKNARETVQKFSEGGVGRERLPKIPGTDLALAKRERISAKGAQR